MLVPHVVLLTVRISQNLRQCC